VWKRKWPPATLGHQGPDAPLAHRRPGYPSSGCVPAEPDSVSPDTYILARTGTIRSKKHREIRCAKDTRPKDRRQALDAEGSFRDGSVGALGGQPPGAPTDPSQKEPFVSRASRRFFGRGIFCTPDFSGASCIKPCQYIVDCSCPEKRSPALRGRNRTRDIRTDGAPMVHLAPGAQESLGAVFFSTPLDTRVMPRKSRGGAASWATVDDLTLRYCADGHPCHVL
jgi:hypothetical protein